MAEKLAQAAGLGGRMDSLIGDLVELAPRIEPADIVVMHRVVCCYPYLDRLLAPAADRARRSLALTYPRRNALTRSVLRLWNAWLWLTRCSFRLYVHAPAEIERIAREHGLGPAFRRRRFIWESVVYERAAAFSG
jgi:magnesium-protoporphyrin O-methyltransferase